MTEPLLSVRNLHTQFETSEGTVRAVDGVSFDVREGETVCLVGESGSGKTVACESITQLVEMPPGEITAGEVIFDDEDLTALSEKELRSYRGGRIGHVFQNPQGALDPVYTIGEQVVEAIRLHRDESKDAARERAIDLLDRVGIGNARDRFDDYPHEFSDGMKQRVVVAMALACDPDLLIADEPTTALDVTIQRQVLDLIADLQAERGMAVLFVTHDLGVVAEIADRVVVLYAGKVMETGDVGTVLRDPSHPYTRALLKCLPGRGEAFETIGGRLPDPTDPPGGCRFHPRCPHAVDDCTRGDQPAFRTVTDHGRESDLSHEVSCLLYGPDHDLPDALSNGERGDLTDGATVEYDDLSGTDAAGGGGTPADGGPGDDAAAQGRTPDDSPTGTREGEDD